MRRRRAAPLSASDPRFVNGCSARKPLLNRFTGVLLRPSGAKPQWEECHAVTRAPRLHPHCSHCVDARLRFCRRQMGDELGRLGARPLPGRQPVGAAGAEIRLPGAGSRRARPDLPPHRDAGCLGQAGAAALLQRDRHQARDVRRRLCRAAARQRHGRGGHQPAGALRRQAKHHGRARQGCLERRGRAAVREGREGARRAQARGQLPCRGRDRPDDLARQGAADLLRDGARRRREGPGRGRSPPSRSPPPRGSSSTRST